MTILDTHAAARRRSSTSPTAAAACEDIRMEKATSPAGSQEHTLLVPAGGADGVAPALCMLKQPQVRR